MSGSLHDAGHRPVVTVDMITSAARRLKGKVRQTPLLISAGLDRKLGRRIMVKAECLQQTGSFKFRGAWSALSALPPSVREKGVLAFSSGNHAQGVALAARIYGVPAVIVMPSDAPASKIEGTRAHGAEIVLYNRACEDRAAIGEALAHERQLYLIRPFDDPDVIAGQGTTGLEIAEQARQIGIDACDVFVPCGGGGLTAGIATALAAEAPAMRVRPVEPSGFDDMARSLESGEILANTGGGASICDAILTPCPGELTFPIIRALCAPGLTVTDRQVLDAMTLAFEHFRIVLEPGGAAALAAALYGPVETEAVIVVASGGNVDPELFIQALRAGSGRIPKNLSITEIER